MRNVEKLSKPHIPILNDKWTPTFLNRVLKSACPLPDSLPKSMCTPSKIVLRNIISISSAVFKNLGKDTNKQIEAYIDIILLY